MRRMLLYLTVCMSIFAKWPSAAEWNELGQAVRGRLIHQVDPLKSSNVVEIYQNPFAVQEQLFFKNRFNRFIIDS